MDTAYETAVTKLHNGSMSEWLKEAVCKIVGASLHKFESCSAHQHTPRCPESQLEISVASCPRSSVVEHFFGKEEVEGPIPSVGPSITFRKIQPLS